MLSDKFVKTAPAGMHADGGGLYLRVSPKGKRVWVRRTRDSGKDTWLTIGTYPAMSLADARRGLNTSDMDLDSALTLYKSKLKVRRPEQVAALLEPLVGLKKLSTATKSKLVEMLQDKAKTAPTHANRMLTRWKDFFNFCEQQGWIDVNPIGSVQRKFIGGKENSRDRVLEWSELLDIEYPSQSPTTFTLWFILLTGLRPTEALWVLRNKRTEKVPTKEHPNPAIHWIPRTPLIRWAIKNTPAKIPKSHLVMSNYLRRHNSTFKPHDLRRTFATRLADLGVAPHVIEKMLDHKMQGMMAIYNHAEYRAERIAAQRIWERKLLSLRKKPPV